MLRRRRRRACHLGSSGGIDGAGGVIRDLAELPPARRIRQLAGSGEIAGSDALPRVGDAFAAVRAGAKVDGSAVLAACGATALLLRAWGVRPRGATGCLVVGTSLVCWRLVVGGGRVSEGNSFRVGEGFPARCYLCCDIVVVRGARLVKDHNNRGLRAWFRIARSG